MYSDAFYRTARSKLAPEGILVTQCGSGEVIQTNADVNWILPKLRTVFGVAVPYTLYIPSFAAPWTFAMASLRLSPDIRSAPTIDELISTRLPSGLTRCGSKLALVAFGVRVHGLLCVLVTIGRVMCTCFISPNDSATHSYKCRIFTPCSIYLYTRV